MQGEHNSSSAAGWRMRFFAIWSGQAFSLVGSALVQFALIWWLAETEGSATILAVASFLGMLPTIVLGPFAGVLVDRWSRRWVLVVADGSVALFTTLLACLFWLGVADIWHVCVILFLRSLGGAFHGPAMMASTSLMVPEEQLTRVAGLNSTLEGAVRFVSPTLGAFLLVVMRVQGILVLDVITAVPAILPLLFVRIPQPAIATLDIDTRSYIWDLVEGFRCVWSRRGLFLLFVTAAVGGAFVHPVFTFVPLLITQHFGGGAIELGWMQSVYGFGFVAGGAILSVWGGFRQRIVTSMMGMSVIGLGIFVVGLVPAAAFPLALVLWFLVGLALPVGLGPLRAIYQSTIPPEMQGRFFTLNQAVVRAMAPLGLFVAGPLADAFGVRILWIITGAVLVGLALLRVLTPAIYRLGEPESCR